MPADRGLRARETKVRHTTALIAAIGICAWSASAVAEPLDLSDTTSRQIEVELENSAGPGVVGVSYGAPVLATYSASGGVGTVTIPIASHQQMRGGPSPTSYTPYVIQIDLGDLGATSQTASGIAQGAQFTQQPLGTDTVAGYVHIEGFDLHCASQQEVDDRCQTNPLYCNQVCNIVPGAAYDPGTGKVNLVGSETRIFCGMFGCVTPDPFFALAGDLRLSESDAPVIPALPAPAQLLLGAGLLLGGCATLAARRRGAGA
jgi:hypothetical protein